MNANDPNYPERAREADERYERDTRGEPDFIDTANEQAEGTVRQIAPELGPGREAAPDNPLGARGTLPPNTSSSASVVPVAPNSSPPAATSASTGASIPTNTTTRIVTPSPATVNVTTTTNATSTNVTSTNVTATSTTSEPRRDATTSTDDAQRDNATARTDITRTDAARDDAPPAREVYEGDDVERLRAEIERTRAEMSRTIDAIQEQASPDKIKERAVAQARAKTVGVVATGLERGATLAGQVSKFARDFAASRQKTPERDIPAVGEGDSGLSSGASYNPDNPQLPKREPSEIATRGKQFGTKNTGSFLKPIREQVVVVFGASSGIGRATALELGKRGARVVVVARDRRGLESIAEDIGHVGSEASVFVADASEFEQVQAVANHAVQTFGRLDTWIHVAAVSIYAKAEETTPDEYARVFEVNTFGVIHGALAALPHIKREGRGAFIAISSVEGYRAFPYQAAYSASKHAVNGFMDALRLEIMRDGWPIAITSVLPAGINTPFFNRARTKLGVKPMPAPPIYQPHVVAEVVLHACEHPTREITAGGAAQLIIALNKLAPGLVDRGIVAGGAGFENQKTKEPRDLSQPDNLYEPVEGAYDHIGGDFTSQAKKASLGNWLETHPVARRAIFAAVALLALRFLRNFGRRG